MIKEFVQSVKENPTQAILEAITVIAVFTFGYILLVLGAVLTGNL